MFPAPIEDAIKQEFYAAFGEAFTGFFELDTVQDEIQPVWHEHTRTWRESCSF